MSDNIILYYQEVKC